MGDVHLLNSNNNSNNNFNVLGSDDNVNLSTSFFDTMKFINIINDLKKKLAENQEHLKQLHQNRIKLSNYTIELEKTNLQLQNSLRAINTKRSQESLQLSFIILLCVMTITKQKFYNQLFANKIRSLRLLEQQNINFHCNSSQLDIFPEEENSSDNENSSVRGSGSVVELRNLSSISLSSDAITVPNSSPPYSPTSSPRSASSTSSVRVLESPPAYAQFLSKNNTSNPANETEIARDSEDNISNTTTTTTTEDDSIYYDQKNNSYHNTKTQKDQSKDSINNTNNNTEELSKQTQFNLSLYAKRDRSIPNRNKKRPYKTKPSSSSDGNDHNDGEEDEMNKSNPFVPSNNTFGNVGDDGDDDQMSEMIGKLKQKLLLLQSILPSEEVDETESDDANQLIFNVSLHPDPPRNASDGSFRRPISTAYKSLSSSSPQHPVFLPPLSPSKPEYLKHRRTNSRLIRALLDHDKILLNDTL